MDLSKLPKMSRTPEQPKPAKESLSHRPEEAPSGGFEVVQGPGEANHPSPPAYAPRYAAEPMVGAQVWLSGILGIICILLGFNFVRWLLATLTGSQYSTGLTWGVPVNPGDRPEGTPVTYWELAGGTAWTELGLFLFGLALLLEASMLLASVRAGLGVRRTATALALVITALATVVNAGVVIYLISIGITLPLISLLAAAFGGYMLAYLYREWSLLGEVSSGAAMSGSRAV